MTEDWRTCVEQEIEYTIGWRVRMAGLPIYVKLNPEMQWIIGYRDADRRLKCPAMYAGYNQRSESHEESTR